MADAKNIDTDACASDAGATNLACNLSNVLYGPGVDAADAVIAVGIIVRDMLKNIRNALGVPCEMFAMKMLNEVINGTRTKWPGVDEIIDMRGTSATETIN